jgi:hypothetical protein
VVGAGCGRTRRRGRRRGDARSPRRPVAICAHHPSSFRHTDRRAARPCPSGAACFRIIGTRSQNESGAGHRTANPNAGVSSIATRAFDNEAASDNAPNAARASCSGAAASAADNNTSDNNPADNSASDNNAADNNAADNNAADNNTRDNNSAGNNDARAAIANRTCANTTRSGT